MSPKKENDSCLNDPNFAIICSFLQHYADALNIVHPTFKELQQMIEDKNDVAKDLVDTIVKLLRNCNFRVDRPKWERRLSKFCRTYSVDDADAIIRYGFKNMNNRVKLRALKELLEYQFDQNNSFKAIVNEMTPERQRYKPLLEDNCGHLFWTMTDSNDDAMVYKENLKKKSWNVLAHDRDELSNIVRRFTPEPAPRRISERMSALGNTRVENKVKAKDLLKNFIVSVGRLK